MTTSSEQITGAQLLGRCLCNLIQFSVPPPTLINQCTCNVCRRLSGAPFLAMGEYGNDEISWKRGNDKSEGSLVKLNSYSNLAVRGSCKECHAPLFMRYHCAPERTEICLGLLEVRGGTEEEKSKLRGRIAKTERQLMIYDAGVDLFGGRGAIEGESVRVVNGLGEEYEGLIVEWREAGEKERPDARVPPL